jgi:hypothetical protein
LNIIYIIFRFILIKKKQPFCSFVFDNLVRVVAGDCLLQQ